MKPCTLRARWPLLSGAPTVWQYLKAAKGRTAYEITAARRIDKADNIQGYNWVLTVVRHSPADIPAGATVHNWYWDKRS